MLKDNKKKEDLKPLGLTEAVECIKKAAEEKARKFVETVDVAINLGIDPKQSNQAIRGSVSLPAGTGKDVRVIVFTADESLQKEAIKAGAVKAGMDELMDEINNGFGDFDYCVATPEAMKSLSKVAKKLGPKGLMPNPKNGNITNEIGKVVAETKKGKINFKNDKAGIVHAGVGKVNFATNDLVENIKAIVAAVKDLKPEGVKGKYIKNIYLTTTMGPSIIIDIDKI